MKRSGRALLQLAFWACYFILVMVVLGILFGREENTAEAKIEEAFVTIINFALIPSAISFYSFYYFIFPKFFSQKKYLLSILIGLIISYCSGITGYLLLSYVHSDTQCLTEDDSVFMGLSLFIGFIAFICGIIAIVIQGFITWFEEVKKREQLASKNHEMEMALVKSQLDPHFLFNTINNIDVLILRDAQKASDYLNHLSDIMRFMLFETKTDEISLSKEIEYIEKYIELQRIRTANELYVKFEVSGKIEGKVIAPMIFIPFIENAFKHTNNKKIENAISISINTTANEVAMRCENKYDPSRPPRQESNGLGNGLISKRLALLYPHNHKLTITNEKDTYTVTLVISNE